MTLPSLNEIRAAGAAVGSQFAEQMHSLWLPSTQLGIRMGLSKSEADQEFLDQGAIALSAALGDMKQELRTAGASNEAIEALANAARDAFTKRIGELALSDVSIEAIKQRSLLQ